jgi:hypothetical protein
MIGVQFGGKVIVLSGYREAYRSRLRPPGRRNLSFLREVATTVAIDECRCWFAQRG